MKLTMRIIAGFLAVSTITGFTPIHRTSFKRNQVRSQQKELKAILFDTSAFLDFNTLASVERSAAGSLATFFQNEPYLSAFVTCSVKASAADLVAQSQDGQQEEDEDDEDVQEQQAQLGSQPLDVRRNLGFLLYGGLYQGMVQEYLYNNLFPSIFGDSHSMITVMEQVFVDTAILTPCLCLPVAYLVKASIASDHTLLEGLQRYMDHVQTEGLLFKYWSLWIPVQFVTFGVIPTHFRIAFVALVSFFWLMILSNISARNEDECTE